MQNVVISIPLSDFIQHFEETIRKVLHEKLPVQDDLLLSSAEVMKLLNISNTTLQAWRDSNKIPFTRRGKKIFYSKARVLESLGGQLAK